MPLHLQPKLLRALQERMIRPVGSSKEIPIDVRVITATNRDLRTHIDAKLFREDLFYRINVIELRVPPLRERGDDVLLCAEHFVHHFAARKARPVRGISDEAAERLLAYDWPGNVRELQNTIERAVALTTRAEIGVADLPDNIRQAHKKVRPNIRLLPLSELERMHIDSAMELAHGNKTVAAKILGIDRRTLYRKAERRKKSNAS